MKKYSSILIVALMATSVASSFAQGTLVFNNGSSSRVLVEIPDSNLVISMPKGGGFVQLFWAATGTAYTPWTASLTPAAWYTLNPNWSLGPVVGFTTPAAGEFNGGSITLSPLAPGGTVDYVVVGWLGSAASFDAALAANTLVGVSAKYISATGNPTTVPPGLPVPLAASFGGLALRLVPEPSNFALAGLGAATLLALRRRK